MEVEDLFLLLVEEVDFLFLLLLGADSNNALNWLATFVLLEDFLTLDPVFGLDLLFPPVFVKSPHPPPLLRLEVVDVDFLLLLLGAADVDFLLLLLGAADVDFFLLLLAPPFFLEEDDFFLLLLLGAAREDFLLLLLLGAAEDADFLLLLGADNELGLLLLPPVVVFAFLLDLLGLFLPPVAVFIQVDILLIFIHYINIKQIFYYFYI